MDFKRLRYALAVADEGNFVRAAEKVSISQPALSRAVQTLEEELGIVLFDRGNRNVTVTKAGTAFFEHARRLVFDVRNMEHDMDLLRSGESGEVAFGAGPLHTTTVLPRVMKKLRLERPKVRVSAAVNNSQYLLEHLRAEELEFFIADVRLLEPAEDIIITLECRQNGGFYCRPGHPLLERPDIQATDLLPFGLAGPTLPEQLQTQFRRLFRLAPGRPLPMQIRCDSFHVVLEVVEASDIVLVASHASLADSVEAGRLVQIPLQLPPMYAEIGCVQLRGRTLSPAAEAVLATIREVLASMPGTEITRQPE